MFCAVPDHLVDYKHVYDTLTKCLKLLSVQVQAYMLEFLFLKLPPDAQTCLTVPCVLQDVLPAFCRGAFHPVAYAVIKHCHMH